MAANTALLQTIQSLTLSKIRELEKLRNTYQSRKSEILRVSAACDDRVDRLTRLLAGTKEIRLVNSLEDDRGVEETLISKLDAHGRKLRLADLYARLLTECMNASNGTSNPKAKDDSDDKDFFVVEERQKQRLQQLCDQFGAVVFEPRETNEQEIHAFLEDLFLGDEGKRALSKLRSLVKDRCETIWTAEEPFNPISLSNCIKGLLTQELLSDGKRAMLKDFLDNEVAMTEIADVLNMRYADLKNWDWHAGEKGIPVLPRQQTNGKYRVWVDEDVLETIFAEFIALKFCSALKHLLTYVITRYKTWKFSPGPQKTERDILRRRYYLDPRPRRVNSVDNLRKCEYESTYFLSHLLGSDTSLFENGPTYDEASDDEDAGARPAQKTGPNKNIKQRILRKVATETLLHQHLHGEAAVIQSDMKWYGTGLPHSTLFANLRFVGFTEEWIDFFTKYLHAPLNMDEACDGRTPTGPHMRQRGVPLAGAMAKIMGELVLFFMDMTVNRESGMLLYRMHDDLWLCGDPAKCAQAWEAMQRYARVTGLEFNLAKTGSVYLAETRDASIAARLPKGPVTIGLLVLDPGVISWIRTWNSCIGRFFTSNFGQPAFCFGRDHVDLILATYEKVQNALFNTDGRASTVTEHLRHMIEERFGVSEIPDAFFFFPEQLGGLGLRNPFVSTLLVRDELRSTPVQLINEYKENEKQAYLDAKKEFEELTERERLQRYQKVFPEAESGATPVLNTSELRTFMSFEEYTRFRESTDTLLRVLYTKLMDVPDETDIELTEEVSSALEKVESQFDSPVEDNELKWMLQLYAEEPLRLLGGLSLVDKRFLPVGVLAMVKGKRVTWQMVL
ncbi:hypothetical protein CNMCM8980_004589 [Aspergillus fumigatiaffinis]|uniref:Reverse transcriptase domain-containing protein n=1 Tax=Aspergillus fumigatiaffinis TaxID=340414 RepID=A0A8H4MAB7_9EURO|nr:hypothetical protein CNMCM6457_006228 [Aspergillus fumigatiaffinis]KAF4237591.1 hypothetical protein CNMCM6805_006922 [Aspergillus fumigatiaffinis]KAF4249027.1 hypothetical protein CNMCM8980_004589 [Aspergillus fumigatiaffinis]